MEKILQSQLRQSTDKFDTIEEQIKSMGDELTTQLKTVIKNQEENKNMIQAQSEVVSKIEEKAALNQEIAVKHMYQPSEEAKKDSAQDMASKIAQDIVDRKMGNDWTKVKAKHTIQGKYAFSVLAH